MDTSQVRHETDIGGEDLEILGVQPLHLGTESGWDGFVGAGRQKLDYSKMWMGLS